MTQTAPSQKSPPLDGCTQDLSCQERSCTRQRKPGQGVVAVVGGRDRHPHQFAGGLGQGVAARLWGSSCTEGQHIHGGGRGAPLLILLVCIVHLRAPLLRDSLVLPLIVLSIHVWILGFYTSKMEMTTFTDFVPSYPHGQRADVGSPVCNHTTEHSSESVSGKVVVPLDSRQRRVFPTKSSLLWNQVTWNGHTKRKEVQAIDLP